MYTPHTVTLVIAEADTWNGEEYVSNYNSVILRGVFLDLSKRSNINKSGLSDADAVTLFIPFSVNADKTYVTPSVYKGLTDKSTFWTIFDGGDESGADCYFIKGEAAEDIYPYATARQTHDYVYQVSSVDLRDFGRDSMRHWMVGGR